MVKVVAVRLGYLDSQLLSARLAAEAPELPNNVWPSLATQIHAEVAGLDAASLNRLRLAIRVPPDRYRDELDAFQAWMDLAHRNRQNPFVVRAQVITELYVAFVWLRDSVMKQAAKSVPEDSALFIVEHFLRTGNRRLLRNAIAHGTWCYLPDFGGLEYWAEPSAGRPHQRFEIRQDELHAWQLLSRGVAIAVVLALTDG